MKKPISEETNNTRKGVLVFAGAFGRLLQVLRLQGRLSDLDMSYISGDISKEEYVSRLMEWRLHNED